MIVNSCIDFPKVRLRIFEQKPPDYRKGGFG
jgi:hypothetical protein